VSPAKENIWTRHDVEANGKGFELRGRRNQPNLHSDGNTIANRMISQQKKLGQFFTPEAVAAALVNWAVRKAQDRLLDPSCGDGQFLACHRRAVGIEIDPENAAEARQRAPGALIHPGDFFVWAERTTERFDAATGNPPFIRYQRFVGETRERALKMAARLGATFNGLSASWTPFL